MSTALEGIIKRHIAQHGPIDVGQFMSLALGHPEHGYYMKQDPLGAAGDFTTAPEISQMFGELLGAWVADVWSQMGAPATFALVECGPGRGTLMADMMRSARAVPGFFDACQIHLLETSPALSDRQRECLDGYDVLWHETLSSLPDNCPLVFIGNEFLDALPIRQLVRVDGAWAERVVAAVDDGGLGYGVRAASPDMMQMIPEVLRNGPDGDVFEVSPARAGFAAHVCDALKRSGGAALFIDYGHVKSGIGDTFQAVRDHGFVSPLLNAGDADLTAHVDFDALGAVIDEAGMENFGALEQGAFLNALGIKSRAAQLMQKADDKQGGDIESASHRLTHSDQMGSLFKVTGFSYGKPIRPAGF